MFLSEGDRPPWLDGVQPATVALVAVAAWRLGIVVVNTRLTMGLMLLGAVVAILVRQPWAFPAVLAVGGVITGFALRGQRNDSAQASGGVPLRNLGISPLAGALLLALFFVLLVGLIPARLIFQHQSLELFESFYRTGSLIFGGGSGGAAHAAHRGGGARLGYRGTVPGRLCLDAGSSGAAVQLQRLPGSRSRRECPGCSWLSSASSCPVC